MTSIGVVLGPASGETRRDFLIMRRSSIEYNGSATLGGRDRAAWLRVATQAKSRAAIVIGVVLLATFAQSHEGRLYAGDVGPTGAWTCVAGVAAGIACERWARLYRHRDWSQGARGRRSPVVEDRKARRA